MKNKQRISNNIIAFLSVVLMLISLSANIYIINATPQEQPPTAAVTQGVISLCVNEGPTLSALNCTSNVTSGNAYFCQFNGTDPDNANPVFQDNTTLFDVNTSYALPALVPTGTISFTPNNTHSGNYTVNISINDNMNCSNSIDSELLSLEVRALPSSTPPASPTNTGTGGGGGGGGGGGSLPTEENQTGLNTAVNFLELEMNPDEITSRFVKVVNSDFNNMTITALIDGIEDIVNIPQRRFTLVKKSSTELEIVFNTYDIEPGVYNGIITLKTAGEKKQIGVTLTVKSDAKSFDIQMQITEKSKKIDQGDNLTVQINIDKLVDKPITINMVSNIKNLSGDVVMSRNEVIELTDDADFLMKFKIPYSFPVGVYSLEVKGTYEDEVDVNSEVFAVMEAGYSPEEEAPGINLEKGNLAVFFSKYKHFILFFVLLAIALLSFNRLYFHYFDKQVEQKEETKEIIGKVAKKLKIKEEKIKTYPKKRKKLVESSISDEYLKNQIRILMNRKK